MNSKDIGSAIVPQLYYPSSDGEPMADNDSNRLRMIHTWSILAEAFRVQGVVAYVSGDLFVYPIEGESWTKSAPDVLVAPRCEQRPRESFKYWEEPGTAEFVGEFLSIRKKERFDSPEIQDRIEFFRTKLGAREVFIYEPLGAPIESGFRFHLLRQGEDGLLHDVPPGTSGWYRSEVLALEIRPADQWIRVRDPATGREFRPDKRRADEEAKRADEEAKRADEEARRADDAERRASQAEARAQRDTAARDDAESRVLALEQEIERLRRRGDVPHR